jgi:hypothetical protein
MPQTPYQSFSPARYGISPAILPSTQRAAAFFLAAVLLQLGDVDHSLCWNAAECPLEPCPALTSCERDADCPYGPTCVSSGKDPVVGCALRCCYRESVSWSRSDYCAPQCITALEIPSSSNIGIMLLGVALLFLGIPWCLRYGRRFAISANLSHQSRQPTSRRN